MDDGLRLLARQIDTKLLGSRLKAARLAAGLKQAELADGRASTAYVSRIEAGQRRPEPKLLAAMADRLGVSLQALLTGVQPARRDELRLQLDYAELSYVTGDIDATLEKVTPLAAEASKDGFDDLARQAVLLHARALERAGDYDQAIALLRDLLESGDGQVPSIEATIALTACYRNLGDPHRAISIGLDGLERLRALGLGGSAEAVKLYLSVAGAYFHVGSTDQAARLCESAMREAENLEDDESRALAYWNASILQYEEGNIEPAIALADRALSLFTKSEDALREARLRNQLGMYQLRLDPPAIAEARHNLLVVEKAYETMPARPVERLRNRVTLAKVDFAEGRHVEAAERANAVLLDAETDTVPLLVADAYMLLGRMAVVEGDIEKARQHFAQAILHLAKAGSDRGIGEAWYELAGYLEEAGSDAEARDAYRNAGASLGLRSRALHTAVAPGAHD